MPHERVRLPSPWKRILWAVDPLSKDRDLERSALSAIRLLIGDQDVPVEPVHVSHRFRRERRVLDFSDSDGLKQEDWLGEVGKSASPRSLLPLRILSGHFPTVQSEADQLVSYARESGADLIVIGTRSRHGPARWLSGSFCETLFLRSDIPVLSVNSRWSASDPLEGILFPTDFSASSRDAFELTLELARRMSWPVVILHKIPISLTPLYDPELTAYPCYVELFNEQMENARKQGQQWTEHALSAGVSARIEIRSELVGTPWEAILDYANRHKMLIAMAAKSGPLSATLVGSTTRKVVRYAKTPVWVVHPSPAHREERLQVSA